MVLITVNVETGDLMLTMMHKRIIFTILTVMLFFSTVSAQEINVDSMDNEQLATLLLQIMQKLDQKEEAVVSPEPTATPVPTNTPWPELNDDRADLEALLTAVTQKLKQGEEPETAPETPSETRFPAYDPEDEPENSIWENKKLIIEALPGYMFIQPTKASKPEPDDGSNITDDSHGFILDDDVETCPPGLHWECNSQRCYCTK